MYVCACICVSPHGHVWFANQQFLVPVSPLLLFLQLLLPQGSRQEVGSRSEAIVKGKPPASSCYERKCIQMCFLCVLPLSSPSLHSPLSLSSLVAENQPLFLLSPHPSIYPGCFSYSFFARVNVTGQLFRADLIYLFCRFLVVGHVTTCEHAYVKWKKTNKRLK